MGSPTSRTLLRLRQDGWTCGITERWNQYSRTRQDLGGGIDVVAWKGSAGFLAVQACAGASHAARRTKLLALPAMREWVAAGGLLEVWSWAKQGPRGKRKLWTCRRDPLTLADFDNAQNDPAHMVRVEIEART